MPLAPQDFVSKSKRVTAREEQTDQEHFLDLCHLVAHPTPKEYDPSGSRFACEMGVTKTSGGQGWAAVFAAYGWNPDLSDEEILETRLR